VERFNGILSLMKRELHFTRKKFFLKFIYPSVVLEFDDVNEYPFGLVVGLVNEDCCCPSSSSISSCIT
jgi:hypothetical protein